MTNIILFGKMGSGKDTVAEYLTAKVWPPMRPQRLGKYIRKHVCEMYPKLEEDKRRTYYQAYGEGLRTIFGPDHWNEITNQGVLQFSHGGNYPSDILIVDARQEHELAYWTAKGFIPFAVDMKEDKRKLRLQRRDGDKFNEEAFMHSTEEAAGRIIESIKSGETKGYVIDNNGILEETYQQIDDILQTIRAEALLVTNS